MKEQDRAREVLNDLLEVDGGLSGWEMDFIEDMNKKRNIEWSDKQIDCLDKIYGKVC